MNLPNLSIDIIEALWVALNVSTLLLTISAWMDARADKKAVKALNGSAAELAAGGTVRREGIRIIFQIIFLAIVVPGLFIDRPTPVTPTIVLLMLCPVLLFITSLWDARDRKAMTLLVAGQIIHQNADAFSRIEQSLESMDLKLSKLVEKGGSS